MVPAGLKFSLLIAFCLSNLPVYGARLEPLLRERVEKVCGFCHYTEYFDANSGQFVEELFWNKRDEILRRLRAEVGSKEIMPPKRSPLQLSETEREDLIEALKALERP